MRKLTAKEVAQISGGAIHGQLSYKTFVDPNLLKNLHAQVRHEMENVLRDMQRSVQDCS